MISNNVKLFQTLSTSAITWRELPTEICKMSVRSSWSNWKIQFMSLEVSRRRTTLMREIALRMPRLLHLSLLKPSHIVFTAIFLKSSRGLSFYSYLELSWFMSSGCIPETEWSYGNCSPPTFGVWIHWHNCCMKFLLEGENEQLLHNPLPI